MKGQELMKGMEWTSRNGRREMNWLNEWIEYHEVNDEREKNEWIEWKLGKNWMAGNESRNESRNDT